MGRNCTRFQEQGHSFSPSGPTVPVNNRFIFSLQTIELQAIGFDISIFY